MLEKLKFWLKKKEEEKENLKSQLVSKKDEFKSKSVMLKYQLIFIKVEIYLNNFANLFEIKEQQHLKSAFNRIKLHNWAQKKKNNMVIKNIAYDLKISLLSLSLKLKQQSRRQMIIAFNSLKN